MVSLSLARRENMAKEKKVYLRETYIKKLKEGKETYEERKSYYKNMSLKNTKNSGNGESLSTGSTPTIKDYGNSSYTINGKTADELIHLSLKGASGLTAEEINAWINPKTENKKCVNCGKQSHLYNTGEYWIEAEKLAGFRADMMVALAIEESGWGTSNICCKKKNFFGYGAHDSDPYNGAWSNNDFAKGIINITGQIGKFYIYRSQHKPGQKDQDTLWLMHKPPKENGTHNYNPHSPWPGKIADHWRKAPVPGSLKNEKSTKIGAKSQESDSTTNEEAYYRNPGPTQLEYKEVVLGTSSYMVPLGKYNGDKFIAPKYIRENYVFDRKRSDIFLTKEGYLPLPSEDFVHMAGPQENYYSLEARKLFKVLKQKLKYEQMFIVRGFEPDQSDNSSHSVGIAMDIYAPTAIEAIRIADTAFSIGARSISIGPKFVHVDAGPEATWGYNNIGVYHGPGTLRVGDIEHGFRR